MCLQADPDDEQRAWDLRVERREELDDLRPFDVAGEQPEVELQEGDLRDSGELFPGEALLQ